MDLVWQIAGLALLGAGWFLASRRWRRPPGIGAAAWFTLFATTLGGLIGSVFWWMDADASFAWDLPPLASRMLGAAALSFGIAGIFVLERPSRARAWLQALMTAVYLVPLAVVIVVLHLDRLDFGTAIAWVFFVIVGGISSAALISLSDGTGVEATERVAGPEALWLLVAGSLIGAWGLALFAAPATQWPPVFNWPADPLTSRLIATMLITLAAVFLVARSNTELLMQARIVGTVYGLGVAAAVLVNVVRGLPWPWLYLTAFATVGVVTLGFLLAGRARTG